MSETAALSSRVGVLLVNLGTPEAATPAALRTYLREFLSDRRVIESQGVLWKLVLNGIILPFRPRAKARAYASIWNHAAGESPLKTITRAQAVKLAAMLAAERKDVTVDFAMRYGLPPIAERLERLRAQGCVRILVVPLYPQYAAATTATVADEAFRALMKMRAQPALRIAAPYYADPVYIEALAASVETTLAAMAQPPEVLIASYHGMPQAYVDAGDPYARQCAETTRLLRARLGMDERKLIMTFQSRFGPSRWLQPYTDETVARLAREGIKRIAVVMPGFAADCLETLEEIAIENAEIFRRNGGETLTAVPCLNDGEDGMAAIAAVVRRELQGWA